MCQISSSGVPSIPFNAWQRESMEAHVWIKPRNKSWATCTAKVSIYQCSWTRASAWNHLSTCSIGCGSKFYGACLYHCLGCFSLYPKLVSQSTTPPAMQDKTEKCKILTSRSYSFSVRSRILSVHILNKHVAHLWDRIVPTLSLLTSLRCVRVVAQECQILEYVRFLHLARHIGVPSIPFNAWQCESVEVHVWITLWSKSWNAQTQITWK